MTKHSYIILSFHIHSCDFLYFLGERKISPDSPLLQRKQAYPSPWQSPKTGRQPTSAAHTPTGGVQVMPTVSLPPSTKPVHYKRLPEQHPISDNNALSEKPRKLPILPPNQRHKSKKPIY